MSDRNNNLSTLASTIKQGVDTKLKDLHTSTPGIIVSFDAATQLATVQPAIKRIFVTRDEDREILVPSDLPILIHVPVIFPRGGGFSLTFPVKKGDECLLVFCERSIDNWHKTGKVKEPTARRFHSLSDATAFVGLSSLVNKVPDYDPINTEIKKDDGSVSVKLLANGDLEIVADGDMTATIGGDIIATCTNLDVTASSTATLTSPSIILNGETQINGTLSVSGVTSAPTIAATTSLTVAGKEMHNHTHIGSPSAPTGPQSNTGTPV